MVFEIQYNKDPAIIWVFAKDEKLVKNQKR